MFTTLRKTACLTILAVGAVLVIGTATARADDEKAKRST